MKSIIIILFLPLLFLSSCSWGEEGRELPAISENGANTFGCKVNGEIWLPSNYGDIFPGSSAFTVYRKQVGKSDTLLISIQTYDYGEKAGNVKGIRLDFEIFQTKILSAGFEYYIEESELLQSSSQYITISQNELEKYFDNLKFKQHSDGKLGISGQFHLSHYDPKNKLELNFTEGRFDVKTAY